MKRNQAALLCASAAVLIIAGLAHYYTRPHFDPNRVYRIGFSDARPLHFPDDQGNPTGLAVGIVRQAARRAGIKLTWKKLPHAGADAVKNGDVDFWVLITDLPERRAFLHITEPFLVTESCFLVRADSRVASFDDLAQARISSAGFGIQRLRLTALLPRAHLLNAPSEEAAAGDLIAGTTDAVFLEQFTLGDLALRGVLSDKVRIIQTPIPRSYLGMASGFETAAAADEIRNQMRAMAADGTMAPLFQGWALFPGLNLEAMDSLSVARQRERFLIAGIGALLGLFACTVGLSLRLRMFSRRCAGSEQYHRTLVEVLPDTIYRLPLDSARYDPALDWLLARPGHRKRVESAMATGVIAAGEETSPEGRHMEYRLVPLHDPNGRVTGALGILRDQTERAQLQKQLLQAQKLESIGQLAGGVAHDFNNLLTVINGCSETLLSTADLSDRGREEVTQIAGAAKRATCLTRKLLAFGRRNEFEPRVVSLSEIVSGIEPILRRLIEANIELVLALGADPDLIFADAGLLEQVIVNLVVNARDAMPDGGRLFIETSKVVVVGEVAAESLAVPEGSYVSLAVTDTGTGMTPEVQARIFEPFFTTKEPGKGTGLGLSTAYGVVSQSGGSIRVHSAPGIGTTFRILLPVTSQPHAPARTEPAMPATGGTETVMLVEDEIGVRKFVASVLEEHGYRVLDAANGTDAVELARGYGGAIDLLITDIVLPGMKSAELIRQFHSLRPSVPVLRMSGYPDRFGAPHLAKPFTAELLLARVREMLDTAVLSEGA